VYIGSGIGNFSPEEARGILRNLRSELRAGDALLLGTDLVKDEATLLRAYDDRDGVTAAFNLNTLHRLNRELGANFDTGCFRHRPAGIAWSHASRCTWKARAINGQISPRRRLASNSRPLKLSIPRTATSSARVRLEPYWMMRASGSSRYGRIRDKWYALTLAGLK
jgi:hypothetical protein